MTTRATPVSALGAEVDAPRSAPSLTLQGNRAQLQQFLDSYVRVTGHEPPPDEIADFMTRRMIPE
jgi:hypothetical protein